MAADDGGYAATEPIAYTKTTAAVRSAFVPVGKFSAPLVEVLLPTEYDKTKRYRTLYLLHPSGAGEPCLRYLAAAGLHDRHDLVCVSVGLQGRGRSWTGLNLAGESKHRQADYLVQAVVPLVERRFATGGRPEDRLLLGFGCAGEAVLRLVLGHPDVFGAAAAAAPEALEPKGKDQTLRAALATQSIEALAKANAAAFAGRPRILLLEEARSRPLVDGYAKLFAALGVTYARGMTPFDGGGDWDRAWLEPAVDRIMASVGPPGSAGGAPRPLPMHDSVTVDGFVAGKRTVCLLMPAGGGKRIDVEVVLPTTYDLKRRYRVLYLLSACGQKDADAMREILALGLHDRYDLICVLATLGGYYRPGSSSSDRLKRLIVPYVEGHYATRGDAEGRLLIGFSKSGYGALSMILDDPGFFGYAASWDAPLVPKRPEEIEKLPHDHPVKAARRQAAHFRKCTRLVVHGSAFWGGHAPRYHKLLDELGIKHHYLDVKPGRDTQPDWPARWQQPGHSWRSGWVAPALNAMVEQVAGGGKPPE